MIELLYIGLILLLLFGSAFFSGSETALFSLSPITLARLSGERRPGAAAAKRMRRAPETLLSTILLGNLLVNVATASTFTLLIITLSRRFGWREPLSLTLGAILITIILLIFGEITPKLWAVNRPQSFGLRAAPVLEMLSRIFFPVTLVLSRLGRLVTRQRVAPPFPTHQELHTMVEMGRELGLLRPAEEEIIYNLVDLGERTVEEVMTPRIELMGIERTATLNQARIIARKVRRSRLPVYDRDLDHIIGILYIKDLVLSRDHRRSVTRIMRPAHFVPESKRLSALLEEFRRQGIHAAIVVDEFGQTAGIVTLEDILEGIFGEIRDEYDQAEIPYEMVGPGEYLVDGDLDLRTLNRIFRPAFHGWEEERLAGFIQEQLGHLPKPGEQFSYHGLRLKVMRVVGNRIEKVLITREVR